MKNANPVIRSLGAFERALLTTDRYAPFNIVSAVQLTNPPPPDILAEALRILQNKHPLLQASIAGAPNQPHFRKMENQVTSQQVIPRRDDDQWRCVVEDLLATRIDVSGGPLFGCVYLYPETSERQKGEVVVRFLHAIADGACVAGFLRDLLHLCCQLRDGAAAGEMAQEPDEPASPARFPADFQGVKGFGKLAGYGLNQIKAEVSYLWHARGKRKPQVRVSSRQYITTLHLPEPLTTALAYRARQKGLTLYSLLGAAQLIAVQRQLYAGQALPMRTFAFANLRPSLDPPVPEKQFGAFLSMLRYTVQLDRPADVWVVAARLNRTMTASFRKGEKFPACMLSNGLVAAFTRLKKMRMGNTGLSYLNLPGLLPETAAIQATAFYGFAPNIDLGPEFSSMATLYEDGLWWGFTLFSADMEPWQAEKTVAEIRQVLEAAIGGEG